MSAPTFVLAGSEPYGEPVTWAQVAEIIVCERTQCGFDLVLRRPAVRAPSSTCGARRWRARTSATRPRSWCSTTSPPTGPRARSCRPSPPRWPTTCATPSRRSRGGRSSCAAWPRTGPWTRRRPPRCSTGSSTTPTACTASSATSSSTPRPRGRELQTRLASVSRLAGEVADAVGVRATTTVERTPLVVCDKALVSQLLTNLLQNAVKYVDPGVTPRVHLAAVGVGDEVRFTLTDNGTGHPRSPSGSGSSSASTAGRPCSRAPGWACRSAAPSSSVTAGPSTWRPDPAASAAPSSSPSRRRSPAAHARAPRLRHPCLTRLRGRRDRPDRPRSQRLRRTMPASLGMMEPMTPDVGGTPLPSAAYGDFFHAAPVAMLVLRARDLVMLEANQPYLDAVGMSARGPRRPLRLRRLPQQPDQRRHRPGDRPPLAHDGGGDQAGSGHRHGPSATTSPAATASTSGGGTSSRPRSSRTARSPTSCTTPRTSPTCTVRGPSSPRPRPPRRSRPPSWPAWPRWRCP